MGAAAAGAGELEDTEPLAEAVVVPYPAGALAPAPPTLPPIPIPAACLFTFSTSSLLIFFIRSAAILTMDGLFAIISICCAAIRICASDMPAIWGFIRRIDEGSIDLSIAACWRSCSGDMDDTVSAWARMFWGVIPFAPPPAAAAADVVEPLAVAAAGGGAFASASIRAASSPPSPPSLSRTSSASWDLSIPVHSPSSAPFAFRTVFISFTLRLSASLGTYCKLDGFKPTDFDMESTKTS
mmetsp:Transcript_42194/g.128012  ORF Transcript_42194/g.128012 Transcript_42194/m.128012 type:complete len:240 (-) Transcript_42194:272-991(-)